MTETVVAKWESRGGRYWLILYRREDGSFGYRGDGCGGNLGNTAEETAIAHCKTLVENWPVKAIRRRLDGYPK